MAFQDAAGKPVTIADFAGKKLLVNFWAPLVRAVPGGNAELDALAAKYNSDDFLVLPINLDIGEDGLREGARLPRRGQLAQPAALCRSELQGVRAAEDEAVAVGLPATLVLDENGCELAVLQGPARWDTPDGENVIEALLGLPA